MFLKRKVTPKRRFIRFLIQATLFLLIYVMAKTWMQKDLVTGVAPAINSRDLAGKVVSLSDYQDGPVLVHFWASWCPVCELSHGAISSVDEGWPVLSVAMQSGSDAEVATYMAENDLTWHTIGDEAGLLATKFGVQGVPVSFVIDPEGNIDFREMGYSTSWGLRFRLWLSKIFS